MANSDTKTEQMLDILANGGDTSKMKGCCNTKTQNYILDAADRIQRAEDEIEEIKNNPDVADIVDTYQDLEDYDKSTLTDKDIIRVLNDETHDGESTYYRYSTDTGTFTYIGESKQYTNFVGTDGQDAGEAGLVPAPATTDVDKYLKSDGTWATVSGGGGSVTVVQTTGTSQTDVMSQNAVSSMVFADPGTVSKVQIGSNAAATGATSISIGKSSKAEATSATAIGTNSDAKQASGTAVGYYAKTYGEGSVAIGDNALGGTSTSTTRAVAIGSNASANAKGAVAIGAYANKQGQRVGEIFVGTTSTQTAYGFDNTQYRLINGVYDGQEAHDAATVGQINATIDAINTALNTNIPHIGTQS